MAFIDFAGGSAAAVRQMARSAPTIASEQLSDLEAAAFEIGTHDGISSLRHEGTLIRLIRIVLAIPRPAPLADPRLEAIRRLAVAAHHGVDEEIRVETRTAVAVGVSASKAAAVLARFGRTARRAMTKAEAWTARTA